MKTQKQPDLQIQGLFPLGCRSAWRRADTPLPLAGLRGSSESIKSKDMWNPCEIRQPPIFHHFPGRGTAQLKQKWLWQGGTPLLGSKLSKRQRRYCMEGLLFRGSSCEKFQCTLHLHVPIGSICLSSCNWIQHPINHVGVTSLRVDW